MSSTSVGDESGYESGEGKKGGRLFRKVTGPSAGLVQQHYVESRQEELYRRNEGVEAELAELLQGQIKGLTEKNWLQAYHKIQKNLQAADLTINFNAESWFAKPNTYRTYSQMYERSEVGSDGKIVLKSDKYNSAADRARIDDVVTFPPQTGGQKPVRRGPVPEHQSMPRIQAQMGFGAPVLVNKEEKDGSVTPSNSRFNAKTKQVFCALNYGRRAHGSSTYYGRSFLVWNDKFKVNSMYFPNDTFAEGDSGTQKQTAYGTLATLLKWSKKYILEDIIISCFHGNKLADTDDPLRLLEAHVFEEMPFKNNLKAVHLYKAMSTPTVINNAKAFAAEHGAKLILN